MGAGARLARRPERAPAARPPSATSSAPPRRISPTICWPCGTIDERDRLYGGEEDGAPLPAVCPFLGLATFDAAHAEYFFGRERLVAELVARLVGSPLLAVVGPSGSGKSSAVRAGLLPALAGGVLPGSDVGRRP